MDENEFQFNGKTYIAKEEPFETSYHRCCSCVFIKEPCFSLMAGKKIPQCNFWSRKDKRDVCFKLKKRNKTNK